MTFRQVRLVGKAPFDRSCSIPQQLQELSPLIGTMCKLFTLIIEFLSETDNLLFEDDNVDVSLEGYDLVYLMKTMDQMGFVVFNENEPCHVVMSPVETQ